MTAVLNGPPQRHRYTVRDYYRMAETGILPPGARMELIEGEIVDMTPIGSRHASFVDHLVQSLAVACKGRAQVRIQNPVRLGDLTEPDPDIALLRSRDDYYSSAHPTAADVFLIIEVADSSLEYDRGTKLPLYARHGIPECWLVNLNDRSITRHYQPGAAGYQRADILRGHVELPGLPGCTLDLPEIPA